MRAFDRLAEFRGETSSYAQAAFRWVLANPDVSCLVISMKYPQQLDEYLYASGQLPSETDVALLDKYDVRYVIVGPRERAEYGSGGLDALSSVLSQAFSQGDVIIYER